MTDKGPTHTGDQRSPKGHYQEAAEGLWQRLKEMLMVRKRLEDFVFTPEADPKGEESRWLNRLAQDDSQVELLATELTLRAFRVAMEVVNYKILVHLKKERTASISTLAELTELPGILIGERINDMAQIGLALRSIENDQVQATLLTDSLLGIIEATAEELSKNVRERFPGLLGR